MTPITAAHLNDWDHFCFTLLLRRTDVSLLVIATKYKIVVVKPWTSLAVGLGMYHSRHILGHGTS